MPLKERGAALITSLITIVIVAGIALLMFNRTLAEMGHSRDNVAITQTVMLARGGANVGGAFLNGYVDDVQAVINNPSFSSPNNRWTFGGNAPGDEPAAADVATAMNALAATLQTRVDTALCNNNYAPTGSSATVSVRIHFTQTACGNALPSKTILPNGRFVEGEPRDTGDPNSFQTYALPFVMVSEARQGDYKRNIVLQGEYRFNVGRSSFARYAYFTNERKVNGRAVTFGTGEMVDGPVHSNEYLRFRGTPWFGGPVTVAGCVTPTTSCGPNKVPGDYFNGTFVDPTVDTAYQSNNPFPSFVDSVTWGADYIALPTNNFKQQEVATKSGLAFPNTLKDLQLSVLTENGKTYQVMRVEMCGNAPSTDPNDLTTCNNPTVREFRYTDNKVQGKGFPLEEKIGGVWQPYMNGTQQYHFQGVLFTAGGIANLGGPTRTNASDPATAPPALASFAQFTVAASGRVVVTRDLKYSDPPCASAAQWNNGNVIRADCPNTNAKNVLGVYAQDGDMLFGTGDGNTLLDLTVQGAFMSSEGRVGTNNWNSVVNQETQLRITGGLIGKVVAGFSWNSGGYQRNITYDPRLGQGTVPPLFPSTGEDRAQVPTFFSYGQREQVY